MTAGTRRSPYTQPLERYNLAAAILDGLEGSTGSGFERDVHQVLAERRPQPLHDNAVRAPLGALVPRAEGTRQLQAGVTGAGAELVFDDSRGFRRALRRRSVTGRLGVTVIDGLQGEGMVVVIGTGSDAEWITEAALITTGLTPQDPTLRRVTFALKIAGVLVPMSRQLLVQARTNPDAEDLVRTDLLDAVLSALDRAALVGSGADGEPRGLFNDPGVPVVAFAGGSTLAKLAEMEETARETQEGPDARGWVVSPGVRRQWRTTPTATGSGLMLMPGQSVLGYPVETTADTLEGLDPTPTPVTHAAGFGAWPELALGLFGALDLVVDVYSGKKQAMVEVAGFLYADVQVLEPQAFAVARDIVVV